MFPKETMILSFLHDVQEDYDVSSEEIERLFGTMVADANYKMTKVFREEKKNEELYFSQLSQCPIASIAKGIDRLHNQSTMDGVFKISKQKEYIIESEKHILPMMKNARRNFPQQELAYENIKLFLRQQVSLFKSMHWSIENEVKDNI